MSKDNGFGVLCCVPVAWRWKWYVRGPGGLSTSRSNSRRVGWVVSGAAPSGNLRPLALCFNLPLRGKSITYYITAQFSSPLTFREVEAELIMHPGGSVAENCFCQISKVVFRHEIYCLVLITMLRTTMNHAKYGLFSDTLCCSLLGLLLISKKVVCLNLSQGLPTCCVD